MAKIGVTNSVLLWTGGDMAMAALEFLRAMDVDQGILSEYVGEDEVSRPWPPWSGKGPCTRRS